MKKHFDALATSFYNVFCTTSLSHLVIAEKKLGCKILQCFHHSTWLPVVC